MTTEKLYTIAVEYYKTKRDVEEGKPNRTGESGFKPMPLQAAIVCKSKMSGHPVCGMIRINKIIQV